MEIKWDIGSAYELFSSLYVIHDPGHFGVRPARAAGVRSRIPSEVREFFSDILTYLKIPLCWLYGPPQPKTAALAVERLESYEPADVLKKVVYCEPISDKGAIFLQVMENRRWTDDDLNTIVESDPGNTRFSVRSGRIEEPCSFIKDFLGPAGQDPK